MSDVDLAPWLRVLAAGDALGGVAHGWPRDHACRLTLAEVLSRAEERGWRTSAVTSQTLLVADAARAGDPPEALVERLARHRAALEAAGASWHLLDSSAAATPRGIVTDTSDALLTALPVAALAEATTDDERADLAIAYVEAVNGRGRAAGAAAALVLAAAAVHAAGDPQGFPGALAEALGHDAVVGLLAPADAEALAAATAGAVDIGPDGVPPDAVATLAALVTVVAPPSPLSDAVLRAVHLGGDTSMVAALAAGVLALAGVTPDRPIAAAVDSVVPHIAAGT